MRGISDQFERTPSIWFVGGGTGGHLSPGLAIAEWLLRKVPVRCQFLTSGRPAERALLHNVQITALEHPLPIPNSRWNRFKYAAAMSKEAAQMALHFVRVPPAAVVGLGAYGSVPAALAAAATGVPLFLLEQNSVPGKANRLLSRWATEVYLQWEHTAEHLPAVRSDRIHVLGNPVRAAALRHSRDYACRALGLDPTKKTLLVMGGSQGSTAINRAIRDAATRLGRHRRELQCLIIAGDRAARVLKGALKNTSLSSVVLPFVEEIGLAYAAADLALCRAGGTSIAELAARGVPAILVPMPGAADDHQRRNARAAADSGGAVVIEEADLTPTRVLELVETLLLDEEACSALAADARRAGRPDAVEVIGRRLLAQIGVDPDRWKSDQALQVPKGRKGKKPRVAASTVTTAVAVPIGADQRQRVHLIGAGGSGVSALGRVYLERGWRVSGSDSREGPGVASLRAAGAKITVGHSEQSIHPATDHVVASASIPIDNPERIAAVRMRIPVCKYSEALGRVFASKPRRVAVAGTHGKTTTSGWVAHLLDATGRMPAYVLGAAVAPLGRNAAYGDGSAFVVEACEYDRSFLNLDPTVAVVTNVEADHLDYYRDYDEIEATFVEFASRIDPSGLLIVHHSAAPFFRRAAEHGTIRCRIVDYGASGSGAEWQVHDRPIPGGGSRLRIFHRRQQVGEARIALSGHHNAHNALAAALAARELGVPLEQTLETLGGYGGASRRMELVAEQGGITVLDDYAHHPTEIRAVLQAIRGAYRGRRVISVFQPHQHSRTRRLFGDFCDALADSDEVIVPDIYAARDLPEDVASIGGRDLVDALCDQGVRAHYVREFEAIVARLLDRLSPGDVVVTMGAGDVDRVAELLRTGLEGAEA